MNGGEGGIRTHGALSGTAVFKTAALNHSATSPAVLSQASAALSCKTKPEIHPERRPVSVRGGVFIFRANE